MPPKKTPEKPFFWAKGKGHLTEMTRGMVYGMYLAGWPPVKISQKLDVDISTVGRTIKAIEAQLSQPQPTDDEPPTQRRRLDLTHQQKVDDRREIIDELMTERREDGHSTSTQLRRPEIASRRKP